MSRPHADAARARLVALDERLAVRFDAGEPAHRLARSRADGMDALIGEAWARCLPANAALSLFAVGGYGRRSLYPQSDVDLLIVGEEAAQQAAREAIASFIAELWDAGVAVSHAVRSLAATGEAAAADLSTQTALMDARPLIGAEGDEGRLAAAIGTDVVWPPREYFLAKREELRSRHARFGDTADNLEPNIKEGPGGLRDLQTLRWMAMRVYGIGGLEALQAMGRIGPDERETLLRAASQLQRLRWGLHLVAGKPEERLRFDCQRLLAARLYGLEEAGNADVERMMQGFYRSAALVLRIGERLLQRFEERLEGETPPRPLDAGFELRGRWLAARHPDWPHCDPAQVLALFSVWAGLPEDTGLHSETARALAESLPCLPDYAHATPALRAQFLQLLQQPAVVTTLRRMSQMGVLSRWIPAFARVTGRMQFDLFHVYTVDQHTLALLGNFALFRHEGGRERFSLAHEVWPRLRKPGLLILAGLFHDIAKGRGGDHSELGAVDAREFCTAMGLSTADTELVAWLVRQHLLMSMTAQKQDISDPEVVQRFAERVADRERLDYLYLLTCADIAATSPKLWNAWKDRLLADLYMTTRLALRRGLENPVAAIERIAETRAATREILRAHGVSEEAADALFQTMPEESFLRGHPDQVAWQAGVLARNARLARSVAARAIGEDGSGVLEVFVHSPDRDGLFAATAATFDRAGLAIQQARLLNGPDGRVFDTFQVLPIDPRRPVAAEAIVQRLQEVLARENLSTIRPPRRAAPRHLQHFRIVPRIEFSAGANGRRTVMSLVCTDRPGLLAEVAQTLRAHRLRVHDARIATFGERAEDVFQLTDERDQPLDESRQQALREALAASNTGENR
ncbi:[protein-PII] uridylyltransferase [Lysobacter pythonis]|uniref:Bifunctional uridylyltransferase/uridylyl-removing enzyme n=1 Tax=Solilutibacter pythonis TaxID=2483112 RepID=A0A3M2HTH5_9GAMM|nr:[protein-PII] uridylyltransferase [Lysobacter pythonis]RMH91123.1 [protein-PII] uridylyltransferase [Lysobacter pythonis]